MFSFVIEIVAWGRWNFELVQLFLDSWIADCFVRHAWFALSVSFCGKIVARGSWNFEIIKLFLDIGIGLFCYARMVSTVCFFFVMEYSCLGQVEF